MDVQAVTAATQQQSNAANTLVLVYAFSFTGKCLNCYVCNSSILGFRIIVTPNWTRWQQRDETSHSTYSLIYPLYLIAHLNPISSRVNLKCKDGHLLRCLDCGREGEGRSGEKKWKDIMESKLEIGGRIKKPPTFCVLERAGNRRDEWGLWRDGKLDLYIFVIGETYAYFHNCYPKFDSIAELGARHVKIWNHLNQYSETKDYSCKRVS